MNNRISVTFEIEISEHSTLSDLEDITNSMKRDALEFAQVVACDPGIITFEPDNTVAE